MRAVIWAFGVVLLELLGGRRVFDGETASETLAAVMMKEPDWERLPTDLPSKLDNLVRRCLEKDPRERVRDVGDVRLAMKGAFETTVSAPAETVTAAPQKVWQRPVPVALGAVLVAIFVSLVVWSLTRAEVVPPDVIRFVIDPPDTAPLNFSGRAQDLVISRDGNQIVYGGGTTERNLNLLAISQIGGSPLRGSEGGVAPFLSPDGEWVGFRDRGSGAVLQKVSMFGGPPVLLCASPNRIFGASWGADDQIIFGTGEGLFRVSEVAGNRMR